MIDENFFATKISRSLVVQFLHITIFELHSNCVLIISLAVVYGWATNEIACKQLEIGTSSCYTWEQFEGEQLHLDFEEVNSNSLKGVTFLKHGVASAAFCFISYGKIANRLEVTMKVHGPLSKKQNLWLSKLPVHYNSEHALKHSAPQLLHKSFFTWQLQWNLNQRSPR